MVELMHQTLDENRLVQNKWILATKVVMGFWKERASDMLWRIYDLASKSQKMWQRWKGST